jgi:hypothetical protein
MSSRWIFWLKNSKTAWTIVIALLLWAAPVQGFSAQNFDYSRYQAADLDEIIEQPRPKTGADIQLKNLKVIGVLIGYGEPCETAFLKKAMSMGGIPHASIDASAVTRCIRLRSAGSEEVRLFIQDEVASFLPKEIRLGDPVTLFVLRVFNNADGPGLLVNEFSADSDGSVRKQLSQKSAPVANSSQVRQTANSEAAVTGLRGEWRRAGPSFVCVVTPAGKLPPEAINPDVFAKACLHMGPFGIGDKAQSVESRLGPPPRTLSMPNGATAWIYFLEQSERPPFFIATLKSNKIIALQVSGPATSKDFTFNHVKLGESTELLVKHFGPATRTGPSGEKDTELWSYPPWPFSFEVRNGLVSSVRISDPAYQE